MADRLYDRYMNASSAWRAHSKGCTVCRPEQCCPTGAVLAARFADLQDAYLRRLRHGGTP
ncbi:hypothetical protein [Streptomyces sp. NPDC057496]|uniref:hypothetical protein n=1 Tax=Streptomyces sp. NPDC057496 TaxID=3346149 RepID=UPI0036B51C73